jgi:PhzF family phenazine biosynthesis protein
MRILQVDAFTDRPFAGNPAGVCLLDEPRDAAWMQAVAAEMNVAETAFLERQDGGRYGLRWFTPAVEVDLCGHATLASAHVLWETGEASERLRFSTRSGELQAERTERGICLDFPRDEPAELGVEDSLRQDIADALRVTPRWFGRARADLLVEVDEEATVRTLAPDIARVQALAVRGLIVTAAADRSESDPTVDFVSRFFAPSVGIAEDPVTGSAHCALAPYWSARLGRTDLVGFQASPRGGRVGVTVAGDRVLLTGQAVTVIRGEID